MLPDDHPWPELGSVSRGATRGNQGSKGSLSAPQSDGRCILQLRVQPNVLAVTLTRQASESYRTLDDAVTSALKLTKGYWRKARRRQDYDSQADQDHIELNEWLQQLKDKVMAHLEMLIAKGEIRGPPYIMSEDQDFPFLRKFIERQTAGIQHNPRLRGIAPDSRNQSSNSLDMPRSETPEDSKSSIPYVEDGSRKSLRSSESSDVYSLDSFQPERDDRNIASSSNMAAPAMMRPASQSRISSMIRDAQLNKQEIDNARRTLAQARKDTQLAFQKYTNLLEAERRAQNALSAADERRGDLMASFIEFYNANTMQFGTSDSPLPPDHRTTTSPFHQPQISSAPHHPMSSPSFANTNRHPAPSPLSGWDSDRQDRAAFVNGPGVAVSQFTNHDRSGHWPPSDGRMNMGSNGLTHTALQNTMPITSDFMQNPQMSVNRGRKHGRDWTYGEIEGQPGDPEDIPGMPPRKRAHTMAGEMRVQSVPSGIPMVPHQQHEAFSASSSHLSAPQSHFRDTP